MNASTMTSKQHLGFGLGLRPDYYQQILETRPKVDWFEILSENYLVAGGRPLAYLEQIRRDYPIVMHGVSMSIGSCDALDMTYLKRLKRLKERVEPQWVSDHLCWTGVNGKNLHDLMPLPYTEFTINHVVERIKKVQDYLGCQILLENVSSYVTYQESDMQEWEFVTEIACRSDCLLLLDLNNVFVSAFNHGFDAYAYVDAIPVDRVKQIHLAGYSDNRDYVIDTHDQPVSEPVWELYEHALKRIGSVSTMIERDDNFPEFNELLAELAYAKVIHQKHKASIEEYAA